MMEKKKKNSAWTIRNTNNSIFGTIPNLGTIPRCTHNTIPISFTKSQHNMNNKKNNIKSTTYYMAWTIKKITYKHNILHGMNN